MPGKSAIIYVGPGASTKSSTAKYHHDMLKNSQFISTDNVIRKMQFSGGKSEDLFQIYKNNNPELVNEFIRVMRAEIFRYPAVDTVIVEGSIRFPEVIEEMFRPMKYEVVIILPATIEDFWGFIYSRIREEYECGVKRLGIWPNVLNGIPNINEIIYSEKEMWKVCSGFVAKKWKDSAVYVKNFPSANIIYKTFSPTKSV